MEISLEQFEGLKKEPLFKGKIVSGSMLPLIKVGDIILVKVGAQKLERFDIIVFWNEGKLTCHYLWSQNKVLEPFLWQTRGLVGGFDFPLEPSLYLGKVISHKLTFWHKLRILIASWRT